MSSSNPCICKGTRKEKMKYWYVSVYKGNHSYFERPKGMFHASDYSTVECSRCTMVLRSKADYVDILPRKD